MIDGITIGSFILGALALFLLLYFTGFKIAGVGRA